jgi:iron(III) transport system substrate-binding protein
VNVRRLIVSFATKLALVTAGATCFAQTPITVYTALEADQIQAYETSFNKAYPDVKVKWVRDSTGIITAKLLAEKAAPQADVVMGLAASSLLLLEKENMLLPYAPKGVDQLSKKYVSSSKPPMWVGMDVWGATICFNTVEAAKQGLTKPVSWQDLLKPEYKGKIVMPNPASSGTGYFDVSAWLTMFGEKKGWEYMDKLHQNIGLGRVPHRHHLRIPGQQAQGRRRPHRPGVPQGGPGLGPGSHRHHEGHQASGRRQEALRLVRLQGRQRTLQG